MGLVRSLALGVYPRSIGDEITSLPETLTSFDKCMAKNYCKYPFIAGCVIGGLIVLSLLWCLIRCCLCGAQCCACCCGGCGGRKKGKDTHTEVHHHHGGPPPSGLGPPGGPGFHNAPPIYKQPPAYHEPPQYATYEVNRNGQISADALPPMPTWEMTKVEVKEEVEMGYVNNEGHRRGLDSSDPERGSGSGSAGVAGNFGYTRDLTASGPGPNRGGTTSPQPGIGMGTMHAPHPITPANGRMGFNPRGPSPGPGTGVGPPTNGPRYPDDYDYGYQHQPQPQYNEEADTRWNPPTLPEQPQQTGGYQPYQHSQPQRNQSQRQNTADQELFFDQGYVAQPTSSTHRGNPDYYEGQTQHQQQYPTYADDYPRHHDPSPGQRRQQEWTVL